MWNWYPKKEQCEFSVNVHSNIYFVTAQPHEQQRHSNTWAVISIRLLQPLSNLKFKNHVHLICNQFNTNPKNPIDKLSTCDYCCSKRQFINLIEKISHELLFIPSQSNRCTQTRIHLNWELTLWIFKMRGNFRRKVCNGQFCFIWFLFSLCLLLLTQ